jgi:hypothetical protein
MAGAKNRFAPGLAHDCFPRLLTFFIKGGRYNVERYLRLIADFFVVLSVALGCWVSPYRVLGNAERYLHCYPGNQPK